MNISASKFSSGCESGWTLYLDQSYISEDKFQRDKNNSKNSIAEWGEKGMEEVEEQEEEEEEEDLSMVSDASSGPPHYHEDCLCENGTSFSTYNWAYSNKSVKKDKEKKKQIMMMKDKCKNEYHSCLDDTASSPVPKKNSSFSKTEAFMDNRLDYSQCFSATHFKGESALSKHFGMFQSPVAKGSASKRSR